MVGCGTPSRTVGWGEAKATWAQVAPQRESQWRRGILSSLGFRSLSHARAARKSSKDNARRDASSKAAAYVQASRCADDLWVDVAVFAQSAKDAKSSRKGAQ